MNVGYRGIWPAGRDVWVEKPGPKIGKLGNAIWIALLIAIVGVPALVTILLLTRR